MKILRLPTMQSKYTEAFLHTFLGMLHIVRDNPDIVHIYGQGPGLLSPIPWLLRPRIQIFFTCGGLDWQRKKWPPWAARIIYLGELCTAVFPSYRIVVSEGLKSYYEVRYGVKAYCIYNGVEKAHRPPPQQIARHGLKAGSYFLFVGRLVPEKKIEDLIRAYQRRQFTSRLAIVGDSAGTESYVRWLKDQAEPDPSILFLGYQFGEVLQELYSNARCFVTPSELEGLPLTLLEALSYGLTCITSDILPHREVLSRTGGRTFPVGDVEALANEMDRVERMSDSELARFAEASTEAVTKEFSWDKAADQLERLYEESVGMNQSFAVMDGEGP
jgi:glycosyltransferase involved in cell wall biosynthesis